MPNPIVPAAAPGLPVPFDHQPGLRALTVFDRVPADHLTFRVDGEDFYPHLRSGEFAVADLADRTPAHGELFLIGYDHPLVETGFVVKICQTWFKTSGVFKGWSSLHSLPPARSLAEGPYLSRDHLAAKLIGRIVGVFVPTRGIGRAP